MLLINLFGSPGSGKSTGAAYIFSQLKMRGVNAELITEFAKDKVWENNNKALKNQAYMFGKQYYRISRCENEVDVIITDSPLLLSLIYNSDIRLGSGFDEMVKSVSKSYDSLNYLINRVKKYNHKGRLQTEEESDLIKCDVVDMLNNNNIYFEEVDGNIQGYDSIVSTVMKRLSSQ